MATVDNIHVSEVERLLKMGRDALFGVRVTCLLLAAATWLDQKLQRSFDCSWQLHYD